MVLSSKETEIVWGEMAEELLSREDKFVLEQEGGLASFGMWVYSLFCTVCE